MKRPRLAPTQVMSTALAKGCEWSLEVDERGPVIDEKSTRIGATRFFSQDVWQEKRFILLPQSPENQRLLLAAMAREWKKWEEHKATLPLTQGELRMLNTRFPNLKIVGTRGVLTPKEPDFKAGLVVQGCIPASSWNRTVALAHDAKTSTATARGSIYGTRDAGRSYVAVSVISCQSE